MGKQYRSAMGKVVDIDALRLANENAIALGNMKVNARGDELGPGGKVVKTRAQLMQEYHKINTPLMNDDEISETVVPAVVKPTGKLATPMVVDTPIAETSQPIQNKPRGSFAEALASETKVETELLEPKSLLGSNKPAGVQRI